MRMIVRPEAQKRCKRTHEAYVRQQMLSITIVNIYRHFGCKEESLPR
jgi:hypothetical protein